MKKANPDDFKGYFTYYMQLVEGEDVIHELKQIKDSIQEFYSKFEDKSEYRYAEGKWTPKEMMQHLIDAERVFVYRALRFSRKDTLALPGYDHEEWVLSSHANERSLEALIGEMISLKTDTINFFNAMDKTVLDISGEANGLLLSPRAMASIIVGHELHHKRVLEEKYL